MQWVDIVGVLQSYNYLLGEQTYWGESRNNQIKFCKEGKASFQNVR